jgi:hypothetical protein
VAFDDAAGSGNFLRAAIAGRPVDGDCALLDAGGETRRARLISLGEPGCTLALRDDVDADAPGLAVGARVQVSLPDGPVHGDVVWARGRERGVLFDD